MAEQDPLALAFKGGRAQGHYEGIEEERARCVAHLRALADSVGDEEAIQVLLEAADDIECGEHVEEVARG